MRPLEFAPGSFLQKDEHTIYHVTALWTNARGVSISCFLDSLEQSLEFGRFVYTLFLADEKGVVVLSVKKFIPIDNFMCFPVVFEVINGFAPQNQFSIKRLLYFFQRKMVCCLCFVLYHFLPSFVCAQRECLQA